MAHARVAAVFLPVFLAATAAPATARAVASAELFRTEPEFYGKFEARIRYAPGDGVISSFFLWKEGSEVSGTFWNELDFEKLGNCRMQTNTLYGNPVMGAEQSHTMPADMCDAYHDYRFEWTPNYIAWFIDSREIRRETGAAVAAFAQNATAGMRLHFNVWPGNAQFGGNFDPAILPVRQYISWVQYSSYENGSFKFEWREDFNATSLPSGWTTGDWASPLNLSTHNPQNVSFVNGIAVLSLTSDTGTGFTGMPPADNSGGAPATGGAGGAAGGGAANNAGAGQASGGAAGTTGGAATGGVTSGGSSGALVSNGGRSQAGAGAAGIGGTTGPMNSGGTAPGGNGNAGTGNGGAANQPSGSGGAANSSGAPAASHAGSAGASGSGAEPPAESSGCGLAVPGRSALGTAVVAAIFALASIRRRRRRRV